MTQHPLPVIICSSKSEKGSQNALTAMEYGAVCIITKPKVGTKQFLEESRVRLIDAVKAASVAKLKKLSPAIRRAKGRQRGGGRRSRKIRRKRGRYSRRRKNRRYNNRSYKVRKDHSRQTRKRR